MVERLRNPALKLATLLCQAEREEIWRFPGCLLKLLQANQQQSLPQSSLLLTAFGDQLDTCQAWVIDPGHSFASLQGCEGPRALSRDIKEGCLTLDIKLISCQDLSQPRVTTIDVSKAYKKNKHVWCKESFVFDARLNYAPSLRSDTGCACLLGGRVEACRVSNGNVREGQRTANSKVGANLGLGENPHALSIPPLPFPIPPFRT